MDNIKTDAVTDVRGATLHYFNKHPILYLVIFVIGGVGVFLTVKTGVPQFLIFSLFCLIMVYAFISNKMRGYMLEQFAKSLGYSYVKDGDMFSVQGSLFSIGHSQNICDIISGKDGDRPVRVFLYTCTVGSGKNSQTYHYTVFENTFNGDMPHILLHKKEFIYSSDVPVFSGGAAVTLEGDFNKYFSLLVEKGFEMEAYEIFTPDFMEELVETAKTLGFEFYQNRLYIYMPKYIGKRSELDAMFALSEKLCSQLEPVIKGMREDVSALSGLQNK